MGSVAEWSKTPGLRQSLRCRGFVGGIKSIVNVLLQRLLNWLFVMPRPCLSRMDREPSGLRQWFQVPRISMALFRIPPLARVFVDKNYEELYCNI